MCPPLPDSSTPNAWPRTLEKAGKQGGTLRFFPGVHATLITSVFLHSKSDFLHLAPDSSAQPGTLCIPVSQICPLTSLSLCIRFPGPASQTGALKPQESIVSQFRRLETQVPAGLCFLGGPRRGPDPCLSLGSSPWLPSLAFQGSWILTLISCLYTGLFLCVWLHTAVFLYEHQSCWSRATLCRGDLILLITSAATLYLSQVTF